MKEIQAKILELNPANLDEQMIIDIEDDLLRILIEFHEHPEKIGGLVSPTKFNSVRSKLIVLKTKPEEPEARVIIGNILGLLGVSTRSG